MDSYLPHAGMAEVNQQAHPTRRGFKLLFASDRVVFARVPDSSEKQKRAEDFKVHRFKQMHRKIRIDRVV